MYNATSSKINQLSHHPERMQLGSAGFTLIEMLVVVAIISVIIGVVVVNQRSFDNSIILSNTTYDVALSLREAQAYGRAGHGVSGTSLSVKYATGIDFNIMKGNTYTLFADTAGTGCYTPASGVVPRNSPSQKTGDCIYTTNRDKPLRTFTINNGMYISKLCTNNKCSSPSSLTFRQLDITNTRSDVNTNIYIHGGNLSQLQSVNSACIEIASPDGSVHERITISKVGTIFVERNTCP